jgi:cholesterol transport system auxiliary component
MTRDRDPAGRSARFVGRLAAVAAIASLGGCISIFPKEKPAQLYRFETHQAAPGAMQASGPPFAVRATISSFDQAAATDRILTSRGSTTAYVGEARWVEPAASLLDEALHAAFEQSGPAALLNRGDLAAADERLSLAVQTFEVRYAPGGSGPPTVVVRIHADLEAAKAPFARAERVFEVETPASSNTLGSIVEAYDGAVTQILGQIVAWVNTSRPG